LPDLADEPTPAHSVPSRVLSKMDDKPSIHSLKDTARYMALDHKPASQQAMRLCQLLAAALTQASDRKTRRGDVKQRQFEDAIGAVVADLLLAFADEDAEGWSYRSSRAGSFTGEYVTYPMYRNVMNPAKEHGIIEEVPGFHERFFFGDVSIGQKGWVSSPNSMTNRYRATNALLELTGAYNITAETLGRHFIQSIPKHPLELRSASAWVFGDKIKGTRMSFPKTPHTEKLEAELHELNRFLDGVVIDGATHRGYRRIFGQGDKKGFRWNKNGRLFAQGHPSYQQLPSEQRLTMKLDGQPVAEIDVRASLLTILHGLMGREFDGSTDPYSIKHIPRAVVKAWVTMTIGFHDFHDDWPTKAVEQLAESDVDLRKFPMKETRPLLLHHIPILRGYPDQELDCFDLMFRESEAVLGTMLALMRDHGIPALSVHDSLIVPRSAVGITQEIIKDQYQRGCGIVPGLKVEIDRET
jgi:hypothetical protein